MSDFLFIIGLVLFAMLVLAAYAYTTLNHAHKLYLLLSGRVPMYKIARFFILMIVGLSILFPVLFHWERHSPLHLEVKPAAEKCVRSSSVARDLLGDGLTFGSEWNFSANEESNSGNGDMTFAVHGSKTKGDIKVTALKKDGKWALDSVELIVDDKHVSIPVN
jgi:hypothetical protein